MKQKSRSRPVTLILLVLVTQSFLAVMSWADTFRISEPMSSAIANDLVRSGRYVAVSEKRHNSHWNEFRFKEAGSDGALLLRATRCANIEDANRVFLQSRLRVSTGGGAAGFEAGDQVVRFSGDTFLVRQGNNVYMVYGENVELTRVIDFLRHVEEIFSEAEEVIQEKQNDSPQE